MVRHYELASEALHAAIRNDWPAAVAAVHTLNAECPGQVLPAMCAWIDTFADRYAQTVGRELPADGDLVELAFMEQGTGNITGADATPPHTRWAGRLIAARVAMDKPAFDALIEVLPDDPAVVGRHIGSVLHIVALGLNSIEQGNNEYIEAARRGHS